MGSAQPSFPGLATQYSFLKSS